MWKLTLIILLSFLNLNAQQVASYLLFFLSSLLRCPSWVSRGKRGLKDTDAAGWDGTGISAPSSAYEHCPEAGVRQGFPWLYFLAVWMEMWEGVHTVGCCSPNPSPR